MVGLVIGDFFDDPESRNGCCSVSNQRLVKAVRFGDFGATYAGPCYLKMIMQNLNECVGCPQDVMSRHQQIKVALRKQPTKCDHQFADPWNEKK